MPPGRWIAVFAAIGLIAAVIALVLTGGGNRAVPPTSRPSALGAPAPSPSAVPGTILLTCDAASPGQVDPNSRAASLRAGPVWFVDGRQLGYVHEDGWQAAAPAVPAHGRFQFVVMIVEVTTGSTAIIKPEAAAGRYFHFVDGYSEAGYDQLPAGDTGFTLAACPPGTPGFNGAVTDFYLGFSIQPGRAAPVERPVTGDASPNPRNPHLPGPRMRHNRMTDYLFKCPWIDRWFPPHVARPWHAKQLMPVLVDLVLVVTRIGANAPLLP